MRILLVQLRDLGDLILTTPAVSALREAHPDAHLTLLTSSVGAKVYEDSPLLDEMIALDRQHTHSSLAFFRPGNLRRILALRGNYDAVVYLSHFTLKLGTVKFALIGMAGKRRIGLQNGNGWFLTESLPDDGYGARHQAQYWLDLVGLLGAESTPRPAIMPQDEQTPLPDAINRPLVVIHPGSGGFSLARRWDAAHFATVADALHTEFNAQIVLVGGQHDDTALVQAAMTHAAIDLTGQTTLPQLAGVIAQADLFIGADSGVMHVASTTDTPKIAIFGPSNHEAWRPWSASPDNLAVVVRSAPECSPCSYVGGGIGLREGCAARTCMRMVTPEQVLTVARQILNGETPPLAENTSPQPERTTKRLRMLGLPVDAITYDEWLDLIETWVQSDNRLHHVCTTNPEFMMIAQDDPNFYNILNRADLCVPDGIGLLLAARYLGETLPERVTGSDGVPIIAERAAQRGWKLFFLGAAPGVADKAADILRERYPGLQIVGIYSGSPAPEEEDAIAERVNASGADILLVAYGAPQQDKWIARNTPRLNVSMAMGVGGSFDFIAGIIPRAPLWMRRAGLEWLYRLYLQPSRIGRMMRLPRFVLAVVWRHRPGQR